MEVGQCRGRRARRCVRVDSGRSPQRSGSRVAGAHDEGVSLWKHIRVAVFSGMEVVRLLRELVGEVGAARCAMGASGEDHVVHRERPGIRLEREPAVGPFIGRSDG